MAAFKGGLLAVADAFCVAGQWSRGGIDDVPQRYSVVLQVFVVEGT